jgi:hypothetical protein
MEDTTNESNVRTYQGGCHCGAVRFEADLDLGKPMGMCNCTLCTKVGAVGVIIKPAAFRLLKGADALSEYKLSLAPNRRVFCRHCGIQMFGDGDIPQIGGAFCSVNVNCLDEVELADLKIEYWDGRHNNWMAGTRAVPWRVNA